MGKEIVKKLKTIGASIRKRRINRITCNKTKN